MDKQKGRGGFIAACILPAVLLFFVFMILPTFNIFRMSLYKWGGFSSNRTFVGFENFTKLFRDMKFLPVSYTHLFRGRGLARCYNACFYLNFPLM